VGCDKSRAQSYLRFAPSRNQNDCSHSSPTDADQGNAMLDRPVGLRRKGGMSIVNEEAIGVVARNGFAKLHGPIHRAMCRRITLKNATRADLDQSVVVSGAAEQTKRKWIIGGSFLEMDDSLCSRNGFLRLNSSLRLFAPSARFYPPAMRTMPLFSRLAACPLRATFRSGITSCIM
jgi:hypothetical protein